jgi:hypothetical protein
MVLSGWATLVNIAPYLLTEIPRLQEQGDDLSDEEE